MDDETLLTGWRAAVRSAGGDAPDAAVDAAGRDLLARWDEPHRRYHDREHLSEVLDAVRLLVAEPPVEPPDEPPDEDLGAGPVRPDLVRLAVWFHDAVYDGRPGDDEEASAVLAERVLPALGVPDDAVARVAALVRMTAAHTPSEGDPDAALLSDADLAILAAPPQRYARYAAAVRAEYAHVPDGAFRAGRAAVLTALVDVPHVYRTPAARARWEAAARANVAAEVAALLSPR